MYSSTTRSRTVDQSRHNLVLPGGDTTQIQAWLNLGVGLIVRSNFLRPHKNKAGGAGGKATLHFLLSYLTTLRTGVFCKHPPWAEVICKGAHGSSQDWFFFPPAGEWRIQSFWGLGCLLYSSNLLFHLQTALDNSRWLDLIRGGGSLTNLDGEPRAKPGRWQ